MKVTIEFLTDNPAFRPPSGPRAHRAMIEAAADFLYLVPGYMGDRWHLTLLDAGGRPIGYLSVDNRALGVIGRARGKERDHESHD